MISAIRFSTGFDTGKVWTTDALPLEGFLARLVLIDAASNRKAGKAWSPADLGDQPGARTNARVFSICAVCLDVDDGTPEAELREKMARLGMRALAFTTFSHLTTTTEVKRSRWENRPDGDTAEVFLQKVKHLRPDIIADASVISEAAETITFGHAPCPRWRVVFPLAEPFVVASHGGANAAGEEWKGLLQRAAGLLGVRHDINATDLARLFYDRRVPNTRGCDLAVDFEVPGELMDLADLQGVVSGVPEDVVSFPTPAPAPALPGMRKHVAGPPGTRKHVAARVVDYRLIGKMFREMPNPDLGDYSWIAVAGALRNSMPEDLALAKEIYLEWESRFEGGSNGVRGSVAWECVFHGIRPVIPATSDRLLHGIRPAGGLRQGLHR